VRLLQAEQIPWAEVHYSDNQPCIDMIEVPASRRATSAPGLHGRARVVQARGGIIDALCDECNFPKGQSPAVCNAHKHPRTHPVLMLPAVRAACVGHVARPRARTRSQATTSGLRPA
jgi:hypothetical protein